MRSLLTGIVELGMLISSLELAVAETIPRAIPIEKNVPKALTVDESELIPEVPRSIPVEKNVPKALAIDESEIIPEVPRASLVRDTTSLVEQITQKRESSEPAPLYQQKIEKYKTMLAEEFKISTKQIGLEPIIMNINNTPVTNTYSVKINDRTNKKEYPSGFFLVSEDPNTENPTFIIQNGLQGELTNTIAAITSKNKKDWMNTSFGKKYCILVQRHYKSLYQKNQKQFEKIFLEDYKNEVVYEESFHKEDSKNEIGPSDSEYRILLLHLLGDKPLFYLGRAIPWANSPAIPYDRYPEIISAIEERHHDITTIPETEVRSVARELLYKKGSDGKLIEKDAKEIEKRFSTLE